MTYDSENNLCVFQKQIICNESKTKISMKLIVSPEHKDNISSIFEY